MQIAELALYAWLPISLCLFAMMKPRHAVIASYLGAWLFLPMAIVKVNILPDISKVSISSLGVLLGVLLFDANRLLGFRFRWYDVPMALWCLSPFLSSMSNGLGTWDGTSGIIQQLVLWGIPYYVGRVYFNDWEGFRELAIGVFIGGLIYVPLCLLEIRVSPQLHRWVYGRHASSFTMTMRFGGWHPTVFMQHGLAVGFWMTTASLVGVWLWASGALKRLWGFPMWMLVVPLLGTTVLCKSAAGILFLLLGVATLYCIKWTKSALPLYVLVAAAPVYMIIRATQQLPRQTLEELALTVFPEERVQSLQTRLEAEDLLTQRALEQPAFGWGRWDPQNPAKPKWRMYDDLGKNAAPNDGMWVITMGTSGLFGLITATATILLPTLLLRRRVPPAFWGHPLAAPAASLAVLLVLHMIDNLLNAMLNPVYVMAMGGLAGLGVAAAVRSVAAMPVAAVAPRAVIPQIPLPMNAPSPRIPLPMTPVARASRP